MSSSESVGDGGSGEGWKKRQMNPHLKNLPSDFLYHIGYSREEAKALFGGVKVRRACCMQPSNDLYT